MSILRDLPKLYRSAGPIVRKAIASRKLWNPQCELTPADPDIQCEFDVKIPLEDGTWVTANIFRSRTAAAAGEKQPVIMSAHPYDASLIPALGKTPFGGPPQQYRMVPQEGKPEFSELTSWEAPDPNFWVPAGYAVVNMNLPGYASSGGQPSLSPVEQADAFGQAIDWIGERDWCTGKVGLAGVSFLAISQYTVAAGQTPRGVPESLTAISPWEGVSDMYQDLFFEGGIEERGFPVFWWHTEVKPVINCSEAEFIAKEGQLPHEMGKTHPFYDDYWKERVPDLSAIDLPMLVCASFSDQGLHTRGSFRVFMQAKSKQKWLYTHRSLKWDAFYSKDAKDVMRSFFDCFLKGEEQNGFLSRAPVRLEVRSSRDKIHEVREEQEWPPARTEYRTLYLTRNLENLTAEPATQQAELSYDARKGELRLNHIFAEDTEVTGYIKLRLWVEARGSDDMALFVGIEKVIGGGKRVRFYGSVGNKDDLVARGLIKASRRALDEEASTPWQPVLLNDREQKLSPGEIVPLEIAVNPSSTFFAAGETLQIVVSPNELVASPPYVKDNSCNRGTHVIHVGGEYDSHLLFPVVR